MQIRQSPRLKWYDYTSNGYYFITICTKNREKYFGDIVNWKMILNGLGKICNNCWNDINKKYSNIELDKFIVMPDHIHWILIIKNVGTSFMMSNKQAIAKDRINPVPTNKTNLSQIIRYFKWRCTYEINKINKDYFAWQSRYWDRIIRDENELNKIREYIIKNPEKLENH